MKSFRLFTGRLLCLHLHDCCVRQRRSTSPTPLVSLTLPLLLLLLLPSFINWLLPSHLLLSLFPLFPNSDSLRLPRPSLSNYIQKVQGHLG
ncbi:hypothetical protein K1719_028572 [Acacia pycnantha]|nr:hypothetical protein K1719_028572 [Acacia pycnantha]